MAEGLIGGFDDLMDMLGASETIEALIESGDWMSLLEIIDWAIWENQLSQAVLPSIKDAIAREGAQTLGELRHGLQGARAQAVRSGTAPPLIPPEEPPIPAAPSPRSGGFYSTARFDMTNPFAVAQAEQFAADLVREVSRNTRKAIREMVTEAFREGVTADVLARRLRNTVGLTSKQARAVENYRQRLLDGGVDPDRADVLTRRYWRRTRNRRAETIARTEIMRASNHGRLQAWMSAADSGLLDPNQSRKEWITAPERSSYGPPCPSCLPMDGVSVMGMETLFNLPTGRQMSMPPAHPNCRCTVVVWPPDPPEDWDPEYPYAEV